MAFNGSPPHPTAAERHLPVLKEETLSFFTPEPGGLYLDGTLGMGGHAEALLEKAKRTNTGITLLGMDRDQDALALASERLSPFGAAFVGEHGCFSEFLAPLAGQGRTRVDGALIDIGVSSMQLDENERGFSFSGDGPLDMRMDRSTGQSAATLVNTASVARLKEIITTYGEEPMAGRIARAIDDARSAKSLETTGELAEVVARAYPAKWRAKARNHPATRTFQALRMVVNNELEELTLFLERILPCLNTGGTLAVITFHSLEDRIVKHFFRDKATGCRCPRHIPRCVCNHRPEMEILTKKPVCASPDELARNPRAGSAKLRVARRLP